MSGTVTRDAEGTVTGNTYDKYGTTNPGARALMDRFQGTLDELFAKAGGHGTTEDREAVKL